MRLFVKLIAMILVAAAIQVVANGSAAGMIDEARFALRVHFACLRGQPLDSVELIDGADELRARQTGHKAYANAVQAIESRDCNAENLLAATDPVPYADGVNPQPSRALLAEADLDCPPGHL